MNIAKKVRNNILSPTHIIERSLNKKLLYCCIDYDLTISELKSFIGLKKIIPEYDEKAKIMYY